MRSDSGGLAKLARRYGIQTGYRAADGTRATASRDVLIATLRAMGAAVDGPNDVAEADRRRSLDVWEQPVAPALVAWDGALQEIRLRAPARDLGGPYEARLILEDGTERAWHATKVSVDETAELDGTEYVELVARGRSLPVPLGYHRLHVTVGTREGSALVIAAPRQAPDPGGRTWGVFMPLHALFTEASWGVGDLSDLGELAEWAAGLGARTVATLPLLAAFHEGPLYEPSPYSPVSRLFWDELFVDVAAAPELELSPHAGSLIDSPGFQRDLERARAGELVDYPEAIARKRRVLEDLADACAASPQRTAALEAFAGRSGRLDDYAGFRAACERHGRWWGAWPEAEREGTLPEPGGGDAAFRYHRYVQLLAEEQMTGVAALARSVGAGLYFDYPLGANPAGYDVWREREAFALGVSVGAPPDAFFAGGQDWGFPPLHPEAIRTQGYPYVIESLRHLCRRADVVRIDHAMWLHRLYWVPRGAAAEDGVYVRYPTEELYAILTLEATRAGTVLVGEDLGTVPAEVRRSMARHGLLRSFVLELEAPDGRLADAPRPPRRSVASLNTHDLAPFAAFWRGGGVRGALRRSLRWLAESPAAMAMVNLEDLWLDPRPQNVPGPAGENPDWRRKARHGLEEIRRLRDVAESLRLLDRR